MPAPLGLRLRPLRALFIANLRTYARNPIASSGTFVVLLVMLGAVHIFDLRGQGFSAVVTDQANTSVSLDLITQLRHEPGLDVTIADLGTANARYLAGKADLEVVVPPDFGRREADGRLTPGTVRLIYKVGGPGVSAAALVAAEVGVVDRRAQGAPQELTAVSEIGNAGVGALDIFLPGLLGFNIVQSGLILAAGIFAGYRSAGVLRRIQVTGVAPANLVFAHAASNVLLTTVQTLVMIGVAEIVYGIHLDIAALLLVTMLGYLVFLGMGFAISGWVRDAQRAPVIASSVGFPMIFLGIFPPGIFPAGVAQAVGLLPIGMVTHALRLIVEGGGIFATRTDLLGLLIWALAVLAIAGRIFRWDE